MNSIYSFFRFLEKTKDERIPFKIKIIYAPETLTKEDLHIKGNLDLSGTSIQSLPKGLRVGEYLYLYNSSIQSLSKGLKVGGYLDLSNTPIQSLPEGLKVGGSLDLSDTPIQSLPEGLKVGGNLYIRNTPLSKKYAEEEIREMTEKTGGYVKGGIFL